MVSKCFTFFRKKGIFSFDSSLKKWLVTTHRMPHIKCGNPKNASKTRPLDQWPPWLHDESKQFGIYTGLLYYMSCCFDGTLHHGKHRKIITMCFSPFFQPNLTTLRILGMSFLVSSCHLFLRPENVSLGESGVSIVRSLRAQQNLYTRWAPTSCKWSYNSYKWPKING